MTALDRRSFVRLVGAGAAVALPGCMGTQESTAGAEEDETENESKGAASANTTSTNETAEGASDEGDSYPHSNGIFIHRYQAYDGTDSERPPRVEGVVENMTNITKEYVEVQVRTYDRTGEHLGTYDTNMSGLHPRSQWGFVVVVGGDTQKRRIYDVVAADRPI